MNHLRIEQVEGVTEHVSTSVIKKLYNLTESGNLDLSSNLKGSVNISGGYAKYKTTLENRFLEFHLSMDNTYIPFNDPAFEAACVARYSSDGIGMTLLDFLAVTDNSPLYAFNDNSDITDMSEFRYFTNIPGDPNAGDVNIINSYWNLNNLLNLTTIIFPDNILYLSSRHHTPAGASAGYHRGTLVDCPNLTNVHLPNNLLAFNCRKGSNSWPIMDLTNTKLTYISMDGDTDTRVTEVYLPNTVTNIGSRSFFGKTSLKKIVVLEGGSLPLIISDAQGYDRISNGTNVTLDLPSNTTLLHRQMFNGGSITTFILRATTPPSLIDNNGGTATTAFAGVSGTDLYVPDESISAYSSNTLYTGFKSIKGLSSLPSSYDNTPPSLRS